MTTLYAAKLALAMMLGNTVQGTATGGGALTLVDTSRTEPDGHFDGGTIFFQTGLNALKTAAITLYDLPTWTFTFPAPGANCAAGNVYYAMSAAWPRDRLVTWINQALREIGPVPLENTTLLTVADQEAYTLPIGVYNVLKVEVAEQLAAPFDYVGSNNYRETPGAIRFDVGHEPDYTGLSMRVTYKPIQHVDLAADSDVISDYLHLERLGWEASIYARRWRDGVTGGDDKANRDKLNELLTGLPRMRLLHPILDVPKTMHLGAW